MTQVSVRVRVPATSANLGPGFDTLGLALQLYNYITLRARDSDEHRVLVRTAQGHVAADENNICFQAAVTLLQHLGASADDFVMEAENHIPFSRGLGSSAAARVGALVAANHWARLRGFTPATTERILDLSTEMEGHPDNAAAALLGGLVISAQRSPSHATSTRSALAVILPVVRYPSFLVWIPESELATKEARAALPANYSRADAVFNISRTGLLLAALATSNFEALREALHDRLHQPYRAPLMPGYNEVVEAARQAGALGATLSGAGSSVLLWLPPDDAITEQAVGAAVNEVAEQQGVPGRALSLPVDTQGCIALSQ